MDNPNEAKLLQAAYTHGAIVALSNVPGGTIEKAAAQAGRLHRFNTKVAETRNQILEAMKAPSAPAAQS